MELFKKFVELLLIEFDDDDEVLVLVLVLVKEMLVDIEVFIGGLVVVEVFVIFDVLRGGVI